ncbi:aspartate dehydrogenase [Candidatus Bathyarchaeota archaeon]|nr:aspartate dehydrogenase [Candidatus Bathyarchaeota archaeon]
MKLGVGLIGCGAIGTTLAYAIDRGQAGSANLVMIYDLITEKSNILCKKLVCKPKVAESFEELIACKDVDIVVEAASQEAVRTYALRVLRAGKDLMIMSVGALVDSELAEKIGRCAKENNRKIYIPSGAIAGLDAVKAATIGKVESVTLTTRKPPKGLKDAPYVKEKKINLEKLENATLIYEGSASEACKLFPANVNVAAALGLAGIGVKKTIVRIIADPSTKRNIHEVMVKGEFGELKVHMENVPLIDNPKTSQIAALSAIATLKRIAEPLTIGT